MTKKFYLFFICLIAVLGLSSCDSSDYSDYDYETIEHHGTLLKAYHGNERKVKTDGFLTAETFAFNEELEEITLTTPSVPAYAFEGCKNLKKVTLKSGIEYIGDYAFKGCENLEVVKINGEIVDISSTAFYGCPKLKEVRITGMFTDLFNDKKNSQIYHEYKGYIAVGIDKVYETYNSIKVGDYAYYGRDALTHLSIPEPIVEIGKMAFAGCANLESISVERTNSTYDSRDNCNAIIETSKDRLIVGCRNTIIPNDVKEIASYAFADCVGYKGVNIPAGVRIIEDNAFLGAKDIETITVNKNNVTYDCRDNAQAIIETATNRLILACNNTVIPSSVKTIASNAFSNVTSETLVIPEGVKTIEDYAFANMTNLKSITLPKSLESISSKAFDGCNNLETIVVTEGNSKYDSRDNCNAVIETATNKIVIACKNTTIPTSAKVIGERAFAGLDNLIQINIPDNIVTIEKEAFADCQNVTSVIIPDSVTTIGERAFANLDQVVALKLPNSVQSIGKGAFIGWKSLISIVIDANNAKYYTYDSFSIIEKDTKALILGCSLTVINEEVKSIKEYAFYGSSLRRINIPATLTNIETGAFAGCKELMEITVDDANPIYSDNDINAVVEKENSRIVVGCKGTKINKSIKIIGQRAYEGSGVFYIHLDLDATKNVEKIEAYAYKDCDYIGGALIGRSVKVIESHAFAGCKNLGDIYFMWRMSVPDGFAEDWNSTNIHTNIS